MIEQDQIIKFLFREKSVRGQWINLDNTIAESTKAHNYPAEIVALLGELTVITSLFIANSKFEGEITFQIQGKGAVELLLVNGDHNQHTRTIARYDEKALSQLIAQGKISLTDLVTNGVLIVSVTPKEGNRYQSIVELKGTIIESIIDYFNKSMQIPTYIYFAQQGTQASAILLQYMPDGIGSVDDLYDLSILVSTTKKEELLNLTAHDMLYRLFNQEQVEVFPSQAVTFKCTCSYDRSLAAIMSINQEEILDIFAQEGNKIVSTCECCSNKYTITLDEYQQILNKE